MVQLNWTYHSVFMYFDFWISRYLVLSASSHIMLHEFMHCEIGQIMNLQYVIFDKKLALWDWAGHEPSICDLWSETCYKWFERLVEYLSICLEKVFWINAWETTYSDFSGFFLFHHSLPLTFKKHYLLYHKTPKVQ